MTNTTEPQPTSITPEVDNAINTLLAALLHQAHARQRRPGEHVEDRRRQDMTEFVKNLRTEVGGQLKKFSETATPTELLFMRGLMLDWYSTGAGLDDTALIGACAGQLHGLHNVLLMNDTEAKVLSHLQKILASDGWLADFLEHLVQVHQKYGRAGCSPITIKHLFDIQIEQFEAQVAVARQVFEEFPGHVLANEQEQ
jgi:hypothetical protein